MFNEALNLEVREQELHEIAKKINDCDKEDLISLGQLIDDFIEVAMIPNVKFSLGELLEFHAVKLSELSPRIPLSSGNLGGILTKT